MIDSQILSQRRRQLCDLIGPHGAAIFLAGHEQVRSNDTEYRFRAGSDVLYLTGFEEPDTVVVVVPEHPMGPLVMFVRERDKEKETWTGRRYGIEGAIERFGADSAFVLADLDAKLPELLEDRQVLHHRLGVDGTFDGRVAATLEGLRRRKGKPPAAPTILRDTRELLHPIRLVKTEAELALLRRACTISAEAHVAAMRACKPGMYEYELQALIEYIFQARGAHAPAYATIVGAGQNGTILHYIENRSKLVAGDLVLIDAGAEYDYYAGDITRTFPASGKFAAPQRELYQAVLDAQLAGIEMCREGVTWDDLHNATVRSLTASMVDLGLLEGDVDTLIEQESYKRFYMHKTGHWLGMDVHDVGPYYEGQSPLPFAAGMVLTVEPGLYVPADDDVPEAFRGCGVRIEDDVLITPQGPLVLTSGVPKTVEDLESLVGSGFQISL